MEALGSLKIKYLEKKALFQSNNGSHASWHGCTPKKKKTKRPDFNNIGFFLVLEFKNKPWKYIKVKECLNLHLCEFVIFYHDL
jgi:hypothetical protein